MVRRTRVYSQSELTAHAISVSVGLQAERITNMTGLGWVVEKVTRYSGKAVVFVRHHNGTVGAVLPSGAIQKAPVGQKTLRVDLSRL